VETLVGAAKGYEQIALYRNVLVPEEDVEVLRESVKKTALTFDEAEGASSIFNAEPMNQGCTLNRIAEALTRLKDVLCRRAE
jgi:hypothetical protein